MANEQQSLYYLTCTIATQFIVKSSNYTNATISYLMYFLLKLIITLASVPIPSQIPQTLFDIISLGMDAVERHVQDINL